MCYEGGLPVLIKLQRKKRINEGRQNGDDGQDQSRKMNNERWKTGSRVSSDTTLPAPYSPLALSALRHVAVGLAHTAAQDRVVGLLDQRCVSPATRLPEQRRKAGAETWFCFCRSFTIEYFLILTLCKSLRHINRTEVTAEKIWNSASDEMCRKLNSLIKDHQELFIMF